MGLPLRGHMLVCMRVTNTTGGIEWKWMAVMSREYCDEGSVTRGLRDPHGE